MRELLDKVFEGLKLDRSEWDLVKFGDVAIQQKLSVDRSNTELTRYVKGEHMKSEDLHLRKWGELTDEYLGPAFIRKFEEGDILYGSRRTYLRKVVIAPFDGITSNTTFVIKANDEVIDSKLLPYLMLSEGFSQHSIRNSKGSVNPYVNWKDLSGYEFLLPPITVQERIVLLFSLLDCLMEKNISLNLVLKELFDSKVKECCLTIKGNKYSLSELIDKLEAGVSVNSEDGNVNESDYGVLKTSAVSEGYFKSDEVKKVVSTEIERLKTKVRGNSIIISRMNTPDLVGANAYVKSDLSNIYLPDRLWQTVTTRKDINIKFLWYVLSSHKYRKMISDLCSGTSNSMKNITKSSFLDMKVILPEKQNQDNVVYDIEKVEESLHNLQIRIQNTKNLKKSLLNQVF